MSYIRPYAGVGASDPGDCGCGCGGGGCGGHGVGLFDSMDPTTWGAGELMVGGVGAYLALKLAGDAMKVGKAVKGKGRKAKRSTSKAASGATSSIGKLVLLGAAGYAAYYFWNKSQAAAAGVGAYMPQSFVNPQVLQMPCRSAAIRIPSGW